MEVEYNSELSSIRTSGNSRRLLLNVTKFLVMMFGVLCVRFILYHLMFGYDLVDALTKDMGISDYLGIALTIPLHSHLERWLLDYWILKVIKQRQVPFKLLVEELILQKVIEDPIKFRSVTDWAENTGRLDVYVAVDARNATYEMALPNPSKTSGSIKVGYNLKRDWLFLVLIFLSTVFVTGYFMMGFLIWLPAIIFTVIIVHRMNEHGKDTWLEISAKGVFFAQYHQLVEWEQIIQASVMKQTSSHFVVNPYVLMLHFEGDKKYECDIGAYQGGWYKVYRAIKAYAPIPVHIEVVEK